MSHDLELAFRMVDAANAVTAAAWSPHGVAASLKIDGSPVTEADVAAERAMLAVLQQEGLDDGFVGEEVGTTPGGSGRRWIADGIDGTRFFAAGASTWGTLLALEVDGSITVAVCSSPMQQRRWWAVRGGGVFVLRPLVRSAHPRRHLIGADAGQVRVPSTIRIARCGAAATTRTCHRRTA